MKTLLVLVFLGFAAVQMVRPAKNVESSPNRAHDLLSMAGVPGEVRSILQSSCADCHSNTTRYPWYAEIQPAGWLLAKHVKDGKRELNFSNFGNLSPKRARQAYEAIIDEVESGRMPLKSYTWIHREARLTPAQTELLVAWAEDAAEKAKEQEKAGGAAGQ